MSDFWLNGACLADKDMGQSSHRLVFYFHSFSLFLIRIKPVMELSKVTCFVKLAQ